MKKIHGMGDRERLLLQIAVISFMTAESISAWEMWRSAPIGSSWRQRSSDYPQRSGRSLQMQCATIQRNLFTTQEIAAGDRISTGLNYLLDRQADGNPSALPMPWTAAISRRSRI